MQKGENLIVGPPNIVGKLCPHLWMTPAAGIHGAASKQLVIKGTNF
jgi:hypothetical protein